MTTDSQVLQRLDDIQTSIETLTRGLTLLAETMGTHSEMLADILEACSADPGESPLVPLLEQIADSIERQSEALGSVSTSLDNLGPTIEQAVIRGVHRASGAVDDDGVVQE